MSLPDTDLCPIIAATDFSEDARRGLQRAAQLAATSGAPLDVLHVVSRTALDALREWVPVGVPERLLEDARQLVDAAAANVGAPATGRVVVGDVDAEILASCARARLLVLGMHGMNPLRDSLLGTTAERLVGRCKGPVLIVRNEPREPYRRVLVAADLLPGCERLLEAVLALLPEAVIAVAHAYDVPYEGMLDRAGVAAAALDRFRAGAAVRARAAIAALNAATLGGADRADAIVERTHPVRLVMESERAIGADLVVVGKRRRTPLEAVVIGSVTRHVLADAIADVLVVPLPGVEAPGA